VSVVCNQIRQGLYRDSVVLMQIGRQLAALPGVEEAGLFIGTEANKQILREAGLIGEALLAGPGDLIIAVRARDDETAGAAMAAAERALGSEGRTSARATLLEPLSLAAAARDLPGANLALISVPGDFAVVEARKALASGLNVMIFSDHVSLAEEVALKREARRQGLLLMGPDCGTAIIGGAALGFANALPRGDIGIIGASGTGIQEVSCLIANGGGGISHAIGTGGRDLSAEVGGITTLAALDLFEADPATAQIVVISKPPAADAAQRILARVKSCAKPVILCLIGGEPAPTSAGARFAATLADAAAQALGCPPAAAATPPAVRAKGRRILGLFCGGTLCAEAQSVVLRAGRQRVSSNVPVPGAARFTPPGVNTTTPATTSPAGTGAGMGDVLIDLGADEFTRARPHPMIDPAPRARPLREALSDPSVGVILLDLILGWGSHPDPAGELARVLAGGPADRPIIVASVTGTEQDPQVRSRQVRRLEEAGVRVAPSNAAATEFACRCL
jgi:FdrA protein